MNEMLSKFQTMFPFTVGADAWRKAWADGGERAKAVLDESARIEAQGLAQARTMMDESVKMGHETLAYWSQLSAEWRKLSLEATRRTAEMFTAPAAK